MNGIGDIAREERLRAARQGAYATPLSEFHPDDPERFQTDTLSPYFERLRNELLDKPGRRVLVGINKQKSASAKRSAI